MKADPVKPGRRAASRIASFRYAFAGWWYVLRTQHNAWIHAVTSLAVLGAALWLRVGRTDWAILILTIAVVWVAEFVNTSVEAVVDLLSPEIHPLAKTAKDIAAAAVLIAALAAAVVGLLVLGPPLWARLRPPPSARVNASFSRASRIGAEASRVGAPPSTERIASSPNPRTGIPPSFSSDRVDNDPNET